MSFEVYDLQSIYEHADSAKTQRAKWNIDSKGKTRIGKIVFFWWFFSFFFIYDAKFYSIQAIGRGSVGFFFLTFSKRSSLVVCQRGTYSTNV